MIKEQNYIMNQIISPRETYQFNIDNGLLYKDEIPLVDIYKTFGLNQCPWAYFMQRECTLEIVNNVSIDDITECFR